MDVSKYNLDGEWIKVEVDSDRELELFEFKVQPIVEAGFGVASKSPDQLTTLACEAVVGWNLTLGSDPIACNDGEKRRYLSRFATYSIKAVNGIAVDGPTNLVSAIVMFAAKPENFLKN